MNRRTVLTTAAAAGLASLAGCLGSGDEGQSAPDPVALSGTYYDYQGGMEIGPHGGPNGQLFYADRQPEPTAGPANPEQDDEREHFAWFHTLVYGLFPYHFDRRERGWEPDAIYVTDYSSVDWDVDDGADRPVMPSPTDPDSFADATELSYVGGSEVMGGMGPALHPFSDGAEAASFVEAHGGTRYEFDDITRSVVSSLRESSEMEM